MTRLILASSSPRRRRILKEMGYRFEVIAPQTFVELSAGLNPAALALYNAMGKAREVAAIGAEAVIIGCDTVIELDRQTIGKPLNTSAACKTLRRLSGRTHLVHSGLVLIAAPDGQTLVGGETTRVTFRILAEAEIDAYVATGEPLDKAGAYALQGQAADFVTALEGCPTNVVGLPRNTLQTLLKRLGCADLQA